MIGAKAEKKLNLISLLDNSVQRRDTMLEDINAQVINDMKSGGPFSLQLDECLDVSFYSVHRLLYSCVTFPIMYSRMSFCAV